MKLTQFKSGRYIQQFEYKSFEPELINHSWTWDDSEVNVLLEKANKLLGELNAFSYIVPDIDLFIAMHILKEATQSSKIEGTETSINEALLPIEEISPERRNDWIEVQNYIKSINFAVEALKEIPISTRLIKESHKILLDGARGENKTPGEFRNSQNWIGGSTPGNAIFVPPHWDGLKDLLSDLEFFIHNEEILVPHLIRIAIIHYQFETIHPFQDGNGRIGRLLITLYLVSFKILNQPSLYLSDYFEKHRALYYDSLTLVREKNELTAWIKFFLKAVINTSEKGISTFRKILKIKEMNDNQIAEFGKRADKVRSVINHLYKSPIVNIKDVSIIIQKDERTANRLVNSMVDAGILKEFTGKQRYRNYYLNEYLNIFFE